MGKGSDYEKLVESAYENCKVWAVDTLNEHYESELCLDKYFMGVPWAYIAPENEPVLRGFIEQWRDTVIEEVTIRVVSHWRVATPRYRPVYERVLEYVVENIKEVWEGYIFRRHELYREIAEDLGISWRTVRDAFWTFRQAGILED